jgi:salicylate hydroxylase
VSDLPIIIIAGGGIGGLATALALARKGRASCVLEQNPDFAEVGAGIQIGTNVFKMFDVLGLTEAITDIAFFPENLVMKDGLTGHEITRLPVGSAEFRARYRYPYGVIYRVDLLHVLLTACRKSDLIALRTGKKVVDFRQRRPRAVTYRRRRDARGLRADRRRRPVVEVARAHRRRRQAARVGHIAYRAVLPIGEVEEEFRPNSVVLWAGPHASRPLIRCGVARVQPRRGLPQRPLRGGLERLRRHGRTRSSLQERASDGQVPAGQDQPVEDVGAVRPRAGEELDAGSGHAGRRCRASDAAISGARRRHGARGCRRAASRRRAGDDYAAAFRAYNARYLRTARVQFYARLMALTRKAFGGTAHELRGPRPASKPAEEWRGSPMHHYLIRFHKGAEGQKVSGASASPVKTLTLAFQNPHHERPTRDHARAAPPLRAHAMTA